MSMSYCSQAPLNRDQARLFYPTLEETISEDHPVRVLDELLERCDFTEWEQFYDGTRGQPPHSPKVMAKLLLYALSRKLRSSRQIEYAVANNLDFIWLTEGRKIDHSTICTFRTRFKKQLKGLFRQLGKLALTMGLVRLNQITFDGTRVKASNSRHATLTAAGLEERLRELDQELAAYLAECEATDRTEEERLGSSTPVPPKLAGIQDRRAALEKALETVRALDEERQQNQGLDPARKPAQWPMTDPDSRVMPNKEGGFAPNYTPLAAVDVGSDFIVGLDVLNSPTEHTETQAIVEQVISNLGERPGQMLADGHHATGQNIAAFENSGTELISPLPQPPVPAVNPALRDDPTQPVPEEQRAQLPRNAQQRLDKSCFIYDAEHDLYHCPLGEPLKYEDTKKQSRVNNEQVKVRIYRCAACEGCPLRDQCLSPQTKHGRTIGRDEYVTHRERHASKMATPESQTAYRNRLHGGEVIFAHIKHVMGLRQFLLRGLEKVRQEWLWTCTSYNLFKLVRYVTRLRGQLALQAAGNGE